MEITNLIPHIESLIFASDKALTSLDMTELLNNAFGFMEDKITLDQVEAALEGINEKYQSEFYPFEVRQSGGGWQFLTKKEYHKTIAQLNGDKFLKRLSSASMETLSIIAYKQPVTKGEIESIRGVSSDYAVQKLLEKELIVITGRNETLPGHPLVYATSKTFMDYFGINSAGDLPKIKEVLADQQVEPTVMKDTIVQDAEADEVEIPTLVATATEEATEPSDSPDPVDSSDPVDSPDPSGFDDATDPNDPSEDPAQYSVTEHGELIAKMNDGSDEEEEG